MLFTPDSVYFLSSKKKIEVLKQIENHKDKDESDATPIVKFLIRDRVSFSIFDIITRNNRFALY